MAFQDLVKLFATVPAVQKRPIEATDSSRAARRSGKLIGRVTSPINLGRSRPCPCGSGKKFKRCCIAKTAVAKAAVAKAA